MRKEERGLAQRRKDAKKEKSKLGNRIEGRDGGQKTEGGRRMRDEGRGTTEKRNWPKKSAEYAKKKRCLTTDNGRLTTGAMEEIW